MRVALLAGAGALAACGDLLRVAPVPLEPGKPRAGELVLPATRSLDYSVAVPEGSISMRLTLDCAETDLTLRVRAGKGVGEAGLADLDATTESGEAEIVLDSFSDPALEPGRWFLQVAWDSEEDPRTTERRLRRIPFRIEARIHASRVDGDLVPGVPAAGVVEPGSGGWRTYRVEVPEGAPALRVDLLDVDSDLDLYARRGGPPLLEDEGTLFAQHFYGRETLLVRPDTDPPLAAGTWYVDVVDAMGQDTPAPFRVLATLEPGPPAALLEVPAMPAPRGDGPLARALVAVVELSNDAGVGSGTVVSEDGWILTNEHVVAALGGTESDELVVAASFDPHRPPVEAFRARVERVDAGLDLALLKAHAGFYGQPLPPGYRFPAIELGEPGRLSIGDPLWLVGFPTTGGRGSRVTISATRGIVSGFDPSAFGSVIKTDAEITSGNSGGAALDAQGRLIGVPTSTVEHGSGQIGYVHPLTLLPPDWRALIEGKAR